LHVEEMLKDVAKSDPQWKIICLRYFNPVGAHESGLIGEDPNGIPNNLVPFIAQVAVGKLPKLHVYGNDYPTSDGTGIRDYIHVLDLAEGHLAAVNYLPKFYGWDVINLGTGHGYSVIEMIESFKQASGKEVPYEFAPRRVGDIYSCYAKAEKASQVLGWHASRSAHDMCSSSWRWQQHRATLS
jgi:UDP-glucose 4-epimerase